MDRRFLAILAAIFIIFIGFIWINKSSNDSDQPTTNNVESSNHTLGEGNSGVTLVEYGDFECPSCASYYPVLKQVKDEYGDEITFQYKHFPLTQIHPNAMAAHRAAEAAAKQNKFWQMHDLLFERQSSWAGSSNAVQIMEDFATELGLNIEQFKQDYASSEINAIINADIASAGRFSITGTPGFVLNDQKIENPSPTIEEFKKVIDQAIQDQ